MSNLSIPARIILRPMRIGVRGALALTVLGMLLTGASVIAPQFTELPTELYGPGTASSGVVQLDHGWARGNLAGAASNRLGCTYIDVHCSILPRNLAAESKRREASRQEAPQDIGSLTAFTVRKCDLPAMERRRTYHVVIRHLGLPVRFASTKSVAPNVYTAPDELLSSPLLLNFRRPLRVPTVDSAWGCGVSFAAWTGLAYGAWIIPGLGVALIRHRRRRCTDCGYASAGLARCPECGLKAR